MTVYKSKKKKKIKLKLSKSKKPIKSINTLKGLAQKIKTFTYSSDDIRMSSEDIIIKKQNQSEDKKKRNQIKYIIDKIDNKYIYENNNSRKLKDGEKALILLVCIDLIKNDNLYINTNNIFRPIRN